MSPNDKVVFAYRAADQSGRLSQGEILSGVLEPLPANIAEWFAPGDARRTFTDVAHEKIVVVTPDCDLLSDFFHRFNGEDSARDQKQERAKQSRLLSHILCCEIYEKADLKTSNVLNSNLWGRVENNQDERYQRIPGGPLADPQDGEHPDFFLDFIRVFSLPADYLYESLESGGVKRRGVIPPPWVHSVTDRLFGFQGRIGLPDPSDNRQLVSKPTLLETSQSAQLPKPPVVP